jgi:hypothetical protein
MPAKLGKKKYKSFGRAAAAVAKKKGISKDRAAAYVAAVERKQGINPRTGGGLSSKKRRRG